MLSSTRSLRSASAPFAVPVENDRGQTVAAINIGAPAAHVPASEMVARYLPLLRETQATLRTVLR